MNELRSLLVSRAEQLLGVFFEQFGGVDEIVKVLLLGAIVVKNGDGPASPIVPSALESLRLLRRLGVVELGREGAIGHALRDHDRAGDFVWKPSEDDRLTTPVTFRGTAVVKLLQVERRLGGVMSLEGLYPSTPVAPLLLKYATPLVTEWVVPNEPTTVAGICGVIGLKAEAWKSPVNYGDDARERIVMPTLSHLIDLGFLEVCSHERNVAWFEGEPFTAETIPQTVRWASGTAKQDCYEFIGQL